MSDTHDEPERRYLGACWTRPAENVPAVLDPAFPISRVAWWSTRPGDNQWGTCPCTIETANECHSGPDGMLDAEDGCRVKILAANHLRGDRLPPLTVFYRPGEDDRGPWLVDDGMHRVSLCLLLGIETWPAWTYDEVGTQPRST